MKGVYVATDLDAIQVAENLTVVFEKLEGQGVTDLIISIQKDAEIILAGERYTALKFWNCGRKIAYLLGLALTEAEQSGGKFAVEGWRAKTFPQISRSWWYKTSGLYAAFNADPTPLATLTTTDALAVTQLVKTGMPLAEALETYKDEGKKKALKEERQRQRDAIKPFRVAAENSFNHLAKLTDLAKAKVTVRDWDEIEKRKAAVDEAMLNVKRQDRKADLLGIKAAEEEVRHKVDEVESLIHEVAPEITIPPDTHFAGSEFEDKDEDILASFADAPIFDVTTDGDQANVYRLTGESAKPLPDKAKVFFLPPGSVVRVVFPGGRHVGMSIERGVSVPALMFVAEQ